MSLARRVSPLLLLLMILLIPELATAASGLVEGVGIDPANSVSSIFQVNTLGAEGISDARESLPKILYLITIQVAVLLCLFFYRVSKLTAA